MTSIAWPNTLEWHCWFSGEKEKALEYYFSDTWRDCKSWPNGPSTRESIIELFEQTKPLCITVERLPLTALAISGMREFSQILD